MRSLTIAWKDFKIRFKDRKGFLMMILMPLVLTAILGAALGSVMNTNSTTFPKTTVGIVLPDKDPLSVQFVHNVLESKAFKPNLTVVQVKDPKRIKAQLKKGSIDVAIVFPKGWSQKLNQGELKKISVLQDPGKPIQSEVIQSIVQTYTDRVRTAAVTTKHVLTQSVSSGSPAPAAGITQQVTQQIQLSEQATWHAVSEQTGEKKAVTSMQYYAAAMAAMFLLYNITVGAKSLLNERETETLARLECAPVSKMSILFGKFLGTLYFALVQFLIFNLATHFLFGVNWGDNSLQTLAIGLSFAVAVSGLSMLIASLIKTEKSANLISGFGIQLCAVIGGSMVPITMFPETLQKIAHFAPNTWALTSFVDIMGGTTWVSLIAPIGVLILIGAFATTIGTWRLQTRG